MGGPAVALVLVLAAGCGRIAFSPVERGHTDGGGADATAIDTRGDGAAIAPDACSGITFVAGPALTAGNNPSALAAGDLDGDGNLDLVVTNYNSTTISVFLGQGGGAFATQVTYDIGNTGASSVAIADLDGDGKLDLAIADTNSGAAIVLLGTGGGAFGAPAVFPAGAAAEGLATGDFDDDGKRDLAVTSFGASQVDILLGTGGGMFAAPVSYPTGANPIGIAEGDITG
ncbi:MAG TPA: VCBS repeat-containing protein, partial [Kofleriaceae bacterium]